MRLVTFEAKTRHGVVRRVGEWGSDDTIIDLGVASVALGDDDGWALDMVTLIGEGTAAFRRAGDVAAAARERGDEQIPQGRVRWELDDVRLLSPLPTPSSIRDFLMVEEHVRRAYENVPPDERPPYSIVDMARTPAYYKGNVYAVYGPGDEIPWPAYTQKLDYELEMALVIGKGGRGIKAQDADAHIAGYTIFNDWSARDIQMREMKAGLGPGLGKDFANSFGPCLRTPDGFDPLTAHMRARINGEEWSSGTVSSMLRSFAELIEWVSQEQTLQPGDIIGSGTIGLGCGLEMGRFLDPGSIVELEVDGIGTLANRVGERRAIG
jgi:2-keto-4-pentenoate hydratase/2-oxohepta-3-ene-1,7-dioic acid hydratase in catechol pathway